MPSATEPQHVPVTQSRHRTPWQDAGQGQHPRAPAGSRDRIMPGYWEGDLIKGAGNQPAVGVLVERTSRLVLLARMEDAAAALAATAKLNAHQCAVAPEPDL